MGENKVKLVLLCGGKTSGKTSAATAIYGYHLTSVGAIPNASIDELGKMSIVYNKEENTGIYFDIDDKSPELLNWREKYINHYVNHVGFADELKLSAANLFGLDYNKLIGTNEEKNEACHILWGNMLKLLSGPIKKQVKEIYFPTVSEKDFSQTLMTNRQFMEVYGTFICRTIYEICHINSAYNKLKIFNPQIGIITDCRFQNEFEFFEKLHSEEVYKIKLKRNSADKSIAVSETGLMDVSDDRFDLVVDNENMTMAEKNNIIIDFLISKGALSKEGVQVN